MLGFCLCGGGRKASIDARSKHYQEVKRTLTPDEQLILQLIYLDLASRHSEQLLTLENFLLFFGLTGLWGAKLFRLFDESSRKVITKEQFFYGLSRTAKAAHQQKIKQLFNFFKDEHDNGIRFIDFTKMLYNYSRDELKEILMEDKYMIPQLNRTISQNLTSPEPTHLTSQEPSQSASISSLQTYLTRRQFKKETVIQLNYEEPQAQDETSFGKTYAKFSQYRDPGTILQLRLNDLTYKVNYCNMITLVRQFAGKIYKSYQIDTKTGFFTFPQFKEWIGSHRKLFESYYTSLHANIWSSLDGEPTYLNRIAASFHAHIATKGTPNPVYGMLVQDLLILADSYRHRRTPVRVVCLQGLKMQEIRDKQGLGIEISHRDEYYSKFVLYFKSQAETYRYLQQFRQYEGVTLHDLYNSHQMIGTGKFSIVYRCTSKQSGRCFALKDIGTEKLTAQAVATLNNESEIMKIISHPQIVKYQETIRSKAHIYIIAEYIYGNDLYEYVKKRKRLTEYISAFIIGKVIEATLYLHSLEIIHRDLKPENIMVMLRPKSQLLPACSAEGDDEHIENIKIIDFGLANHRSELEKSTQRHGIAGTPNYIAPEVILGELPTFKADTFAIGSILYFLLSGRLAFANHCMEYTLLRTARGEYDLKDDIWQSISPEAKDLISQLLQTDPHKRIGLEQALNHAWFEVVAKKQGDPTRTASTSSGRESATQEKAQEQIKLQTLNEINVQEILVEQLASKVRQSRI